VEYISVGITTGYCLDGRGSIPGNFNIFSVLRFIQTCSVAHTASYLMSTGGLYLGVKRLERESDHQPLSSAEVKNDGGIPPLSIRHLRVVIN
jgi:hypothetical protein